MYDICKYILIIYISVNQANIHSDDGLVPVIGTNAGFMLIGLLGTNFNDIRIANK